MHENKNDLKKGLLSKMKAIKINCRLWQKELSKTFEIPEESVKGMKVINNVLFLSK